MSIHDDLLEYERESRRKREQVQRLAVRYNIMDAIASLPQGHPAATMLEEALALLEE